MPDKYNYNFFIRSVVSVLTFTHLQPETHHSVEIDPEVHVVVMKKGISVLVLSHTEVKSEQKVPVQGADVAAVWLLLPRLCR